MRIRRNRAGSILVVAACAIAVVMLVVSRSAPPQAAGHAASTDGIPAHAFAATGARVRILPIGDSITAGGNVGKEYTYRWPLARMLQDEGLCFDFIGSHSSGFDPQVRWPKPWDSFNEGYYGATTAQVRDMLVRTLPALPAPDIALVHLGTNDRRSALGGDTIVAMRDIVRLLRTANPRVVILIALIKLDAIRGAVVHMRVAWLAARETTEESPIVTVNQYSTWNTDPAGRDPDTFDGVHPNLRGQRKMAEAWLSAMRPFLPPSSTWLCSAGPTNAPN